jgi:vancomycin resistance protein YoaR
VSTGRKATIAVVAAPLVVIALVAAAWGVDAWRTGDDVVRNVTVAGAPVGGADADELTRELDELAQQLPSTPIEIDAGEYTLTSTAGELGLSIDAEATADEVHDIGRDDPLPTRPVRWFSSMFSERAADVVVSVDVEQLSATLVALQGDHRTTPVEPGLSATEDAVSLVPGSPGQEITVDDVVTALPSSLGDVGEPIRIEVAETVTEPQVSDEAVQQVVDQANSVTGGTVTLDAGGTTIEVEGKEFRPAFGLAIDGTTPRLTMQPEPVAEILAERAPSSRNPTNVRFDIVNGVPVPVGGEDAQICCTEDAPQRIVDGLLAGETTIALPTRVQTAAQGREWAAGLGVKEIIGSFTTNHKCCESRVTNIHRISDLTRGILIPPGGTFSVNDTVGRRTVEKGFVEGGVIQDGEFSTDIGGGVSQYATTLFNAAFFGGLDIPTYKAHSKYISRYPFGREATLAYPSVDLKIRNETPYGVVIWPTYTNTSITVDLWSTRYAVGEQTAQNPTSGCGKVTTERTRTFPDGRTEVDTFRADYDCE